MTPKKPKRAAPNLAANAGTRKPQGQAIKRCGPRVRARLGAGGRPTHVGGRMWVDRP
jgi:hypothetical protein